MYTGTRPGVSPAIRAGEGVAGTLGSLLPGVLPPELVACVGAYRQRHVSYITSAPPPPQPHPQLQFVVGRRFSCRGAEAGSCGLNCSADHSNSPVLLYMVVDAPGLQVCRSPCRGAEACPMVWTVRRTIVIHQLQSIDKVCAGQADSSSAGGEETVEFPQLQLVRVWTLLFTRPLVRNNRCWVLMPVVQRQQPQVQFLLGGGRRCAHAAMRSSCRSRQLAAWLRG